MIGTIPIPDRYKLLLHHYTPNPIRKPHPAVWSLFTKESPVQPRGPLFRDAAGDDESRPI